MKKVFISLLMAMSAIMASAESHTQYVNPLIGTQTDDTGALTVAAAFGRKGEEEIRRLIGEIARRNPGVRVGFSAENQKAWRELTRERKGA